VLYYAIKADNVTLQCGLGSQKQKCGWTVNLFVGCEGVTHLQLIFLVILEVGVLLG